MSQIKQLVEESIELVSSGVDLDVIGLTTSLKLAGAVDLDYDGYTVSFGVHHHGIDYIAQVLENSKIVDTFEVLEADGSDAVIVVAYLLIDYVVDYQDDITPITEAYHINKVNFLGKKTVKTVCQRGFKLVDGVCQKISGEELANRRLGLRAAQITKRGEGSSLKRIVKFKTKRAKTWRKLMHVKSGKF